MYQNYLATNRHIIAILKDQLKGHDENKLFEIATKINQYNMYQRQSDKYTYYHTKDLYIQITKESKSLFEEIESSALIDNTLSEFLRCLIHEYALFPQFEKERCIFFDLYTQIIDIIEDFNECIIKTKDNESFMFHIDDIYIDESMQHRVIHGFKIFENSKEFIKLKLVDIDYITTLRSKYSFTQQELDFFENNIPR